MAGLKAAGVSAEAAPFVAHGAKALLDLGFTGQAVRGLITQSPQFLDALKDGDTESAARIGTNILASGTLTALGAGKTFEDAGFVKDTINGKIRSRIENLKAAKYITGRLDQGNHLAGEGASELEVKLHKQMQDAGITNPTIMGGVRRYIEAQGDTELMQDQHDATAGTLPVRNMADINTPTLNPSIKDFGQKKNFDKYVADNYGGDENAAKAGLGKIVDAVRYTDDQGKQVNELLKPRIRFRLLSRGTRIMFITLRIAVMLNRFATPALARAIRSDRTAKAFNIKTRQKKPSLKLRFLRVVTRKI